MRYVTSYNLYIWQTRQQNLSLRNKKDGLRFSIYFQNLRILMVEGKLLTDIFRGVSRNQSYILDETFCKNKVLNINY